MARVEKTEISTGGKLSYQLLMDRYCDKAEIRLILYVHWAAGNPIKYSWSIKTRKLREIAWRRR